MSRLVTISTGRKVRIDSDGIVEIDGSDFRLLSVEDQEYLNAQSDAASFKGCGKSLARSSFDSLNRNTEDDRHCAQGVACDFDERSGRV